MSTTVCPNIDWVGYVDWGVRDFHGYDTERGSTYNAYLVHDEKTALVDAVKADYAEDLLAALAAAGISPPTGGKADASPARDGVARTLDYVICNHAEPDHAGALPRLMQAFPGATLVCDAKCRTALGQYHNTSGWKFQVVSDGDTLCLGRRTLQFFETPMVHWPESMCTYVPEEKLLFSMDAFGQHYATSQRFDDEVPLERVLEEAKTYYANIVMPYGKAALPCLSKLAKLPIRMIAPSHGLIWRTAVEGIMAAYRDWVACRARAKVLVIYDTMWDSTAQMAQAIYDGAGLPGVEVQLLPLRRTNLTRIAAEVLDAAAVALGSPTLNRGMMPEAAAALHYLQGLRPQGKVAVAFGSYGWNSGGPEALDAGLRAMGWDVLRPPLAAKFRPTAEMLQSCHDAGRLLGERAVAAATVPNSTCAEGRS
jgi:flavorubredoxin